MESVELSEDMDRPVLLKLERKNGSTLTGVMINNDVPAISGFLAIKSQEIERATLYVALDSIESFTVLDSETCDITAAFPALRVNIKT